MKQYHKVWALLLALIMLLSMAACSQDATDPTESQATQATTEATQPTQATEDTQPTTETTEPAPQTTVQAGQTFRFTELAVETNGAGGLTYYYTADAQTLTPMENWDAAEKKWYHGADGVLVYPAYIPADNYGIAGSSASEYVVMGYELPATGVIDLYTWVALQGEAGQHGYRVKVAVGDITDVKCQYVVEGDTQTVASNNYGLAVEAGQTLYMIYEPTVKKNAEWFGYITSVTYVSVGKDSSPLVEETMNQPVFVDEPVNFTSLSTNKNGANGLTYYYTSDGETLTPFLSRIEQEDKWYQGGAGVLVYPRMNMVDNYGIGGSSATEYVAMGMVMPETGTVELYTWTALQGNEGSHGYIVKVALGSPDNVVGEYGCIGPAQTVTERIFTLQVEAGQTLYMIYEPTVRLDGEWFGYKTSFTYTEIK